MLHPEYFDNAAQDILDLYTKLDESGVAAICKRIARLGKITSTTIWQAQRLQEAGLLYDEMMKMIANTMGASEKMVRNLFEDAAVESTRQDGEIYQAAGLTPPPLFQSPAMLAVLQAGLEKTSGLMRNLTLTTAVSSQQAYIQAADLAYLQITTGLMNYQAAIVQAVKAAGMVGLTVLYPSGHIDKIDVAIRRACLTGVNQTCAQAQIIQADEVQCDLVETTAHAGARPSHIGWQGKVFSRSGTSEKYPDFVSNTGYGTGAGLCGWNCRHSFFPFFEGLSESAYPRQTLNEYKHRTVDYNGKTMSYYDATQMQRKMEREIRKTKRTLAGIDAARKEANFPQLDVEFYGQSVKLKQQKNTLKEFCSQTGLSRQTFREQVYVSKGGGFGKSVAQKAVWGADKDRTEYQQLKKYIVPNDFPKTLAEYKEMKYNDSKRWREFMNQKELFAKIDSNSLYAEEYKEKLKTAYQFFAQNGFIFREHALNRFCGQKTGRGKFTFNQNELLNILCKDYNYQQADSKMVRFYHSIAVVSAPDTDEIIGIIVRKQPKSDWRAL